MVFVNEKLKECREESGLSIDDLMFELDRAGLRVSRNTLLNWESGATSPDATNLAVIACVYKKPVQYFFAKITK